MLHDFPFAIWLGAAVQNGRRRLLKRADLTAPGRVGDEVVSVDENRHGQSG